MQAVAAPLSPGIPHPWWRPPGALSSPPVPTPWASRCICSNGDKRREEEPGSDQGAWRVSGAATVAATSCRLQGPRESCTIPTDSASTWWAPPLLLLSLGGQRGGRSTGILGFHGPGAPWITAARSPDPLLGFEADREGRSKDREPQRCSLAFAGNSTDIAGPLDTACRLRMVPQSLPAQPAGVLLKFSPPSDARPHLKMRIGQSDQ